MQAEGLASKLLSWLKVGGAGLIARVGGAGLIAKVGGAGLIVKVGGHSNSS